MRTPDMKGLPVMPEADVLRAIRKLEFQGPRESNDLLGPSVEVGVSGRSASSGGPLLSPSPRDLGLLLDDALIDDLLFADGPRVSIPVEMALGALASGGTEPGPGYGADAGPGALSARSCRSRTRLEKTIPALNGLSGRVPSPPSRSSLRAAPEMDTLGLRWRMTSWSGREPAFAGVVPGSVEAASMPVFLPESPLVSRRCEEQGAFAWDPLASRREVATSTPAEAARGDSVRAIARAKRSPSPFTVALASAAFPGWGQALNEERGKSAVYRFCCLATLSLAAALAWRDPLGRMAAAVSADPVPALQWIRAGFTTGAFLWILAIYDAFVVRIAHRR